MERKTIKSIPAKPPGVFSFSFKIKCSILALIGLAFYFNTLWNGHALDDGRVIDANQYVQDGISGIGETMTTDAYDAYNKEMNSGQALSGGRYRPLSEVIFGIEHAVFGEPKPGSPDFVRHFVNLISFIACILSVFFFVSKYLLSPNPLKGAKGIYGEDVSFLAVLLFTIHPIHTEVVANVKSLDEILSLLFIMLTFIFTLRYCDSKKNKDIILGSIFYLLALLSKEYALTLVVLLPMLIFLLRNKNFNSIARVCILPACSLFVYLLLRYHAVGFHRPEVLQLDIINDPYLLATKTQRIATEYYILLKYFGLLFVPFPLLCDYSYAQIPYQNFSNILVLVSLIITYGMVATGIILLVKKSILAFPVWFYLLNLAMISNLFIDIGATMGERLIFHSSLGFTVLLSFGIFKLTDKWKSSMKKAAIIGLCSLLIVVCGYATINRNAQWKNDTTLFTHDIHYAPNNTMINCNAGACTIGLSEQEKDSVKAKSMLDTSIRYLHKAMTLFKGPYIRSYQYMGAAYYQLHIPDSAWVYWDLIHKNYPAYPMLPIDDSMLARMYLARAGGLAQRNNLPLAIGEIKKAIDILPGYSELWYNLGGAYFTAKYYDSAHYAWEKTLSLNPNHAQAKQGLSMLQLAAPK